MKKVIGSIRRTVEELSLIKDGDRVAVGLSGGKDSSALLYALTKYRTFSSIDFEIEAITIAIGFQDHDLSPLQAFCDTLNVHYTIEKTDIREIVFDIRKEKNPCSLCAKLRRGALHNVMERRNLNVLALGHHLDDAIETFFMNMFYNGKLSTLEINSHLSKRNIRVIRPMINVFECDVVGAVKKLNLPIIKNPCPVDKTTKREEAKKFVSDMSKKYPKFFTKIQTALKNEHQTNLWF